MNNSTLSFSNASSRDFASSAFSASQFSGAAETAGSGADAVCLLQVDFSASNWSRSDRKDACKMVKVSYDM